jgi:hypothetical protein
VSGVSLGTALLPAFTGRTAGAGQHAPRSERVSTAADGTQGDGASSAPITTPNGRYIAFRSSATNLVPEGVTHPGPYSYDQSTGTGTGTRIQLGVPAGRDASAQADISAGPQDSTRDMDRPSISGDGRRVAHQDNGTGDVWVADRATGAQTEADDGTPSTVVQLSANGRVLAMDSADGSYVRDLRTGRVQHFPGIRVLAVSPDRRRLLTRDADTNLTLRGLYGGREIPVGQGSATADSLSAHGHSVVYSTVDADVVPGDTNGMYDVFQWRST